MGTFAIAIHICGWMCVHLCMYVKRWTYKNKIYARLERILEKWASEIYVIWIFMYLMRQTLLHFQKMLTIKNKQMRLKLVTRQKMLNSFTDHETKNDTPEITTTKKKYGKANTKKQISRNRDAQCQKIVLNDLKPSSSSSLYRYIWYNVCVIT